MPETQRKKIGRALAMRDFGRLNPAVRAFGGGAHRRAGAGQIDRQAQSGRERLRLNADYVFSFREPEIGVA